MSERDFHLAGSNAIQTLSNMLTASVRHGTQLSVRHGTQDYFANLLARDKWTVTLTWCGLPGATYLPGRKLNDFAAFTPVDPLRKRWRCKGVSRNDAGNGAVEMTGPTDSGRKW